MPWTHVDFGRVDAGRLDDGDGMTARSAGVGLALPAPAAAVTSMLLVEADCQGEHPSRLQPANNSVGAGSELAVTHPDAEYRSLRDREET